MSKIKLDYITNSSSSSFIIAYKDIPELDQETLNKYPFLSGVKTMIHRAFNGSGDKTIRNMDELNSQFIENYGWKKEMTIEDILEDDEYLNERYFKMKEKIQNGYSITIKDIDNNEEQYAEFIRDLDDGVNIIVEGD